jgi:hypothetical protein
VSSTPRSGRDVSPNVPPPFGTWRNLYWLLLVELAALVAFFTVVTRWAS